MAKLLFIDTECTGADEKTCSLVEIGAIYIDAKTEKRYNSFISPDPKKSFEAEALEIMGTTMKELDERGMSQKEGYENFISFLDSLVSKFDKKDKLIVFAYNASFDNRWLRQWFEENDNKFFGSYFWNPWIDIMSLAADKVMLDRPQLKDFKLMTVAKYFGVDVDESKAHGALYDAEIAMKLYDKIKTK